MLTNSFCCFQGVSHTAERKIWRAGCLDWHGLPFCPGVVSQAKLRKLIGQLPEMQCALAGRLAGYFLSRLPPGHRLRAWPAFQAGTVFLDIETTGLGPDAEITVIGVWRDGCCTQYVKDVNLPEFLRVAGEAELLITFNGIRFDWPVVERHFGVSLPLPHIDLMYEARAQGYTGGLKAIERRMGLCRSEMETGDGVLAVDLWRRYDATGDGQVLERLMRYNQRDVRSLVSLSKRLLQRSIENYPGPRLLLPDCG